MSLLDSIRRALARQDGPGVAAALEQAITAHEAGRLEEAQRCYEAILRRDPRNASALHLLGLIAHQRGDQTAALKYINRAIAIDSGVALFYFNLGNVLVALEEFEPAAAAFSRALQLGPERFDAWFNLGKAEAQRSRGREAIVAFRHAFELDKSSEAARHELARALIAQADQPPGDMLGYDEGIALLADHWQFAPDPLASRLALAHALESRDRWSEAAEHYTSIIEARRDTAPAHWGLGNCYNRLGRMDEAVSCYRAALELDPEDANIASSLVAGLIYDENCTPQAVFEAHRRWGERYAARHYPRAPAPIPAPDRQRRLRVGYLSPDFHRHPVTALFLPVIERHDPAAVEIFCYHNFPGADAVTERVRRAAHQWREVASLDDAALAARIQADDIDILVDLSGHTSHQRLLALARRPAPLQVSWLGYFATTGVESVDYFITDSYSSPPGQDRYFVEKLVRLPDTRFCYQPTHAMPEPNELPASTAGQVTFGCFNNLAKLGPRVLSLWAKILAAVPDSVLYLQAVGLSDSANRERFLALAERCGIPADRVELWPFVPIEHAAFAYHDVDIALDPYPFGGGMTSFEALWMGVPIVTLEQKLIAGRQTTSMLANLGLGELIAQDEQAYVAIAGALARDRARLADLRQTLRERFAASPLADYAKFTRALESAYRRMWHTLLAGGPKEPLDL
ncbi:MAG: tetratricopeptide repeat protein [Betaproteobacteria bacterium]|nr:tetratricopeptide repeat protein [Betaproteobacteria bacterium]